MTYHCLRAYVRPQLAARVSQALIDSGCRDLFLDDASRVVAGRVSESAEYSVQIGQKVEPMIRLEVIGTADEVHRWLRIVRAAGSTLHHGDGVVTVSWASEFIHLSGPPTDA